MPARSYAMATARWVFPPNGVLPQETRRFRPGRTRWAGATLVEAVRTVVVQGHPFATIAGVAAGRVVASRLYEVTPGDPVILILAVSDVLTITLLAVVIPAGRAAGLAAAQARRRVSARGRSCSHTQRGPRVTGATRRIRDPHAGETSNGRDRLPTRCW